MSRLWRYEHRTWALGRSCSPEIAACKIARLLVRAADVVEMPAIAVIDVAVIKPALLRHVNHTAVLQGGLSAIVGGPGFGCRGRLFLTDAFCS